MFQPSNPSLWSRNIAVFLGTCWTFWCFQEEDCDMESEPSEWKGKCIECRVRREANFVFAAPSWSWMRQFGHAVKWKIDLQTLNWFENKDTCLYLVFWFPVHLPFEKLAKTPHWHQTKQDPSYRLALEWFIQQFPLINYTLITYFQGNIKGNLPATSPRILTGKHSLGMVLPIGCQEKEIEADADGWSPSPPYSIMGKPWMLLQKRVGHRLVWETCFFCSRGN